MFKVISLLDSARKEQKSDAKKKKSKQNTLTSFDYFIQTSHLYDF